DGEDVAGRILESCRDLGCGAADKLDDLAAVLDDRLTARRGVVDHDVDNETRCPSWWPADAPGASHLTGRIVERGAAVSSASRLPAEDGGVEGGRSRDIRRWNFHITDLSIGAVRHDVSEFRVVNANATG